MANSIGLNEATGGKPTAPLYVLSFDVALDTYVTGGVAIDALIEANASFKATKLPAASIFGGFINLDADAQGVIRVAEFLPATRKIVLKKGGAGPALEEQANGAIGATVAGTLIAFLR